MIIAKRVTRFPTLRQLVKLRTWACQRKVQIYASHRKACDTALERVSLALMMRRSVALGQALLRLQFVLALENGYSSLVRSALVVLRVRSDPLSHNLPVRESPAHQRSEVLDQLAVPSVRMSPASKSNNEPLSNTYLPLTFFSHHCVRSEKRVAIKAVRGCMDDGFGLGRIYQSTQRQQEVHDCCVDGVARMNW